MSNAQRRSLSLRAKGSDDAHQAWRALDIAPCEVPACVHRSLCMHDTHVLKSYHIKAAPVF